MENFVIIEFDYNNPKHVELLEKFVLSHGSELVSRNVFGFVKKNIELNKIDGISNVFIIEKDNENIGLAFLNYHPEEIRNEKILPEEIEIGLGLLPEFRGKHLGSLFEREFCEYLLDKYIQFDEVVARLDSNNIGSKKAVKLAGFDYIKDDEYHYRRK